MVQIFKIMKKYKHLFFDLDKTIWDFETNSKETLKDIFQINDLQRFAKSFENFQARYFFHNEALWDLYRKGKIEKENLKSKRFYLTNLEFGCDDQMLAEKLAHEYLEILPTKQLLFPSVHETLAYLQSKYRLHIITNGFNEVQYKKLDNCDLSKYFDKIITSEDAGALKPNPDIFRYALKQTGAHNPDSVMIGDDLKVDILGAKSLGIDQVFFNPEKVSHVEEITFEISEFEQLRKLF